MSLLGLALGPRGAAATMLGEQSRTGPVGSQGLTRQEPRPGWVEVSPEGLWQAALGAVRQALGEHDGPPVTAVGVTATSGTTVLWDRETLGSPRPAITSPSPAVALAWLAEHEPHTWALVESGRYAIGTLDSYLVARMTRGTWHVTDVSQAAGTDLLDLATGAWSSERCTRAGVPLDALPELVPTWGHLATTEPRTFLGLEVEVAGIVADRQAAMIATGCVDEGDGCTRDGSVIVNAGPRVAQVDGLRSTAAWRSPDGLLTFALEGPVAASVALRSRPEPPDAAALGAARLAGLGSGVWDSLDELRAI